MKKLLVNLIFSMISFFVFSQTCVAEELSPNRMSINTIPMNNIIGDKTDSIIDMFNEPNVYGFMDTKLNRFVIELQGNDYASDRNTAEMTFLKALDITQNEACFLKVMVNPGSEAYSDAEIENSSDSLSFCSSPTQQDLNDDSEVNGVDFGQCIADYETSDEAESAFDKLTKREAFTLSTGQTLESLNELDLPCDFNVNRRIDALDLSKVIEAIKSPTSPSK